MNYNDLKPGHYIAIVGKAVRITPRMLTLVAVVLFFGFVGVHNHAEAVVEARSCAGLRAQGLDPQKVFDTDHVKYKRLDHNHNGKACE